MVFTLLHDKKRKEKESIPMNKISRKGFLKIAAAAAMSGVTAGALAACNSASSSTASGAAGQYIPGTYEGTAEGISSTVKVTMTFSDSAVTDVVVDTSGETASFGAAAADELREQLLAAGSAEIDGVSGSTITSDAVMKAAKSCYAQAKGEAVVSSVQLPTGDANDWLGKEPDIDETAITETVDTDILIVGAGNGGMFAAAYAAANGLNFRVIEQNANVQDTRHWYGAIDSAAAKAAGEETCQGWMEAAPSVGFTVWDHSDRRTIYLLNTDWASDQDQRPATFIYKGKKFPVVVRRYHIETIHCADGLAVMPASNTTDILSVCKKENGWVVKVQTTGNDVVHV